MLLIMTEKISIIFEIVNYMICGTRVNFYNYLERQTQRNFNLRLSFFKKGKIHKSKVKFYDAHQKNLIFLLMIKLLKIKEIDILWIFRNKKIHRNFCGLVFKIRTSRKLVPTFNHSISKLP